MIGINAPSARIAGPGASYQSSPGPPEAVRTLVAPLRDARERADIISPSPLPVHATSGHVSVPLLSI
jgi:hypothetical protein